MRPETIRRKQNEIMQEAKHPMLRILKYLEKTDFPVWVHRDITIIKIKYHKVEKLQKEILKLI
ncbi:MAG: hypothetical protein JXR97_05475 [Planctomycetes bacterium]|nr:hypothetical protein [Planctomycetota bacterium]